MKKGSGDQGHEQPGSGPDGAPNLGSAQVIQVNSILRVTMLRRNVLDAKRRPSDITLEDDGDSAGPVANEAGIPEACESLEVGCLLSDQGEKSAAQRPATPRRALCERHEVLCCWLLGPLGGHKASASPRRLHSRVRETA